MSNLSQGFFEGGTGYRSRNTDPTLHLDRGHEPPAHGGLCLECERWRRRNNPAYRRRETLRNMEMRAKVKPNTAAAIRRTPGHMEFSKCQSLVERLVSRYGSQRRAAEAAWDRYGGTLGRWIRNIERANNKGVNSATYDRLETVLWR